MIAPLGVWGGLVFRSGSSTLNQQVGGTFNDAQRSAGGRGGLTEAQYANPKTEEEKRRKKKKIEDSAAAARGGLTVAQWEHPLTEEQKKKKKKRLEDDAKGGINSGPGGNQTGNAGWSGAGVASRDYTVEGSGDRYHGLHFDTPTDELAAVLARTVEEDGSFLNPPPLCGIGVSPGHRGVTRGKGLFGLDVDGSLVGGVHNSNEPNVCVSGATIPVTTREPPFKVPKFAVGPLRAGKIVLRVTNNSGALKKMNKKK